MKNYKNKKELWFALKNYNFDHVVPTHLIDHVAEFFGGKDASLKAFANKLASKLNWTTEFSLAAIDEYKKYVYLAIVSDYSVTPSLIIDKVWHEHILFSQAYRKFCDEVIKYRLDHEPELIPVQSELDVFSAQYLATLDLYKKEFNMNPPESIWGKAKFKDIDLSGIKAEPKKKIYGGATEEKRQTTENYRNDDTPLWIYYSGDANMNDYHNDNDQHNNGHESSPIHSEPVHHEPVHHDSGSWHSNFDTHSVDTTDAGGHDSGGHSGCSASSCGSSCGGGGGD